MIIALDYDGTYTREPALWKKFISDAQKLKHTIICITMRNENEPIKDLPDNIDIYYTNREAKFNYAAFKKLNVDIWIDDKPMFILEDSIR